MTDEALLESLDRHFIAGCPSLSTSQLREHQARGACADCESRAKATAATAEQADDAPANPVEIADDLFESAFGWRPGGTR
jgi:hypothetical protein